MVDPQAAPARIANAVREAEVAISTAMSQTVLAGSSRTVEVTCSTSGIPQSVKVSSDFAKTVAAPELSLAIRETLRAAQSEAVRLRVESLSDVVASPVELGRRLHAANEMLTGRLEEIRTTIARLKSL